MVIKGIAEKIRAKIKNSKKKKLYFNSSLLFFDSILMSAFEIGLKTLKPFHTNLNIGALNLM